MAHPVWSWGCVWLGLAASAISSEPLPPWETIETEFGPLRIREIGVPEGPFVVLIHDKPDTEFVRNEWNSLAVQLGAASFHVLIPDLHSAPEVLRPGKLTGETLREVFARTLCSRNRMIPARYHSVIRPKAIVMGSSWGADMAAEVAALDDVVAVALVTPQIGAEHLRSLQNIQGRVAVALAKTSPSTDGKVLDLASAKQQIESAATGLDIQWIEADADRHGVISNFELPLVEFAESARELFVHGGEL